MVCMQFLQRKNMHDEGIEKKRAKKLVKEAESIVLSAISVSPEN